jgi:hypothetical protein
MCQLHCQVHRRKSLCIKSKYIPALHPYICNFKFKHRALDQRTPKPTPLAVASAASRQSSNPNALLTSKRPVPLWRDIFSLAQIFNRPSHRPHDDRTPPTRTKMSTLLPPKAKRAKREELQRAREQQAPEFVPDDVPNVVVQLRASDTGTQLGGELHIPGNASAQQLDQLVNKLLGSVCFFPPLP